MAGLHPQSPCQFVWKPPAQVWQTCGPPTTVTWLQLLRKQANIGTSTILFAETSWSTLSRIRALPDL